MGNWLEYYIFNVLSLYVSVFECMWSVYLYSQHHMQFQTILQYNLNAYLVCMRCAICVNGGGGGDDNDTIDENHFRIFNKF